jgi:hypothetical protein
MKFGEAGMRFPALSCAWLADTNDELASRPPIHLGGTPACRRQISIQFLLHLCLSFQLMDDGGVVDIANGGDDQVVC